jgi:hypothetical protein
MDVCLNVTRFQLLTHCRSLVAVACIERLSSRETSMAADIFADYLVGQLVTPGTPPGSLPSPVTVIPPGRISRCNMVRHYAVPTLRPYRPDVVPLSSTAACFSLCILVFRISSAPTSTLSWDTRSVSTAGPRYANLPDGRRRNIQRPRLGRSFSIAPLFVRDT